VARDQPRHVANTYHGYFQATTTSLVAIITFSYKYVGFANLCF